MTEKDIGMLCSTHRRKSIYRTFIGTCEGKRPLRSRHTLCIVLTLILNIIELFDSKEVLFFMELENPFKGP
jgi:hypothetical protein